MTLTILLQIVLFFFVQTYSYQALLLIFHSFPLVSFVQQAINGGSTFEESSFVRSLAAAYRLGRSATKRHLFHLLSQLE